MAAATTADLPTNAQDDSQTSDAEQTNLLVGNNSGLSDEATTVRANAMQGTVQGVYGGERRNTLVVLVTMACCNIPQVVAVLVVLSLHWDSGIWDCENPLAAWALVHAAILTMSVFVTWKLYVTPRDTSEFITTMRWRSALDVISLVWFVFGNMWTFGSPCKDSSPPIYWLCFALLIAHYVVLCAPCIGILILVPIMCLCLPCLIKVANYMNAKNKERLNAWIKQLPVSKFNPDEYEGDTTCSICLCEYESGDDIRKMPTCDHHFHAACIDEWLLLNASCPVCRQPLRHEQDSSQDTSTEQDGNQTNVWTELIQFDQSLEEDEELEHPNQHHSNMV